ncbi:hypothetical protein PRK78_000294 [Emydomyces testavorans]|uniref:Uncharacterized protein n=1 Tax=Emydomyces testavorans TaxID=2070801 RepID=A0AAF0IFT4_9EURO|nr:hypothetical protein PRK78_000294 [Emydomyces testavorans]
MEYREQNQRVPAPKPLRILKTRRGDGQGVPFSIKGNPPIPIPRRRSSYAIHGPFFSDTPPLPELDKENYRLLERRQTKEYWHSLSSTPSSSGNFQNMENALENKRQIEALTTDNQRQRVLVPKNGFFSRVTQAFDFRNRQSSNEAINLDSSAAKVRPSAPISLAQSKKPVLNTQQERTFDTPLKGAESKQSREDTPPLPTQQLWVPRNRMRCKSRLPRNAPVTTAVVELTADALRTESGKELSTWVSVEILARVDNLANNLDDPSSAEVPLDVMIVVDNSISPDLLKGGCRNAFYVASSLDILIDRVAIGCMSANPGENLNLMLPLEAHSLDAIRNVFRSLPAFQLLHDDDQNQARLSGALKDASSFLLRHSSRLALCHLFLVTPCSSITIAGGWNERLRFHTISPENSVVINAPTAIGGWHLSASLDYDRPETTLKSNLKLVVRHLRTGIDSGLLSDLSVDLNPAEGYEVMALLGNTKRKYLRPGESWTLLVKVRERGQSGEEDNFHTPCSTSTDSLLMKDSMDTEELDNMIDQLHGMLKPTVNGTEARTIVTATVGYTNSCLAGSTTLKTGGSCKLGWIGVTNSEEKAFGEDHRSNATSCEAKIRGYGTSETIRTKVRRDSWRLGIKPDCENREFDEKQLSLKNNHATSRLDSDF